MQCIMKASTRLPSSPTGPGAWYHGTAASMDGLAPDHKAFWVREKALRERERTQHKRGVFWGRPSVAEKSQSLLYTQDRMPVHKWASTWSFSRTKALSNNAARGHPPHGEEKTRTHLRASNCRTFLSHLPSSSVPCPHFGGPNSFHANDQQTLLNSPAMHDVPEVITGEPLVRSVRPFSIRATGPTDHRSTRRLGLLSLSYAVGELRSDEGVTTRAVTRCWHQDCSRRGRVLRVDARLEGSF